MLLEIGARDAEKLALRRVVDENGRGLPIDAGHHHEVQRRFGAAWLEAHDQRAALLQLFLEIGPISFERKDAKARVLEIGLHVRCKNSAGLARIKLILN